MGECFQTLNLTNAYLFAAALQDEDLPECAGDRFGP